MKLLSINSAKAVWLFPTIDLSPRGQNPAGLLNAMAERYKFEHMPSQEQIFQFATNKQAISFGMGRFASSRGAVGLSITYYNDGLMVETRAGTDVSDEVLSDLLSWLHESFSMTNPDSLRIRKIYASELFVQLEQSLSFLHPSLKKFADFVESGAGWHNPTQGFEMTGLVFGPNPLGKSQHPTFRLERDASAPFEDERYFSAGPLQTKDHLLLIEQIERTLLTQ